MKTIGRNVMLVPAFALVACTATFADEAKTPDEPKAAIMLDAGEGTTIDFPLHPTSRLVDAASNQAGLSLFEIVVSANSAGAPPHTHTHEDEFFYVREGSITFMADDKQKTITAGGLVMLPRGGMHAMWNASEADAVLLVGTSAGEFDDFFDVIAMEVASSGALSPPEVGAIVGRVGAERGILIDMSQVPNEVRPLYGMPPIE
ncbi:MAG: cupin domain-containing protein [Henriciella sp.]